MVTVRSEKKAKTRRSLIDAALRLSAERGFSALSLREVARAAKIAPTAFYRHFRDMDDLGLALVDEVGLSLRQLIRQARQRGAGRGRGVVRASVEAFMEFVHDNANLFRVLLGERLGSSPAFRKALHTEMDRFIGELTEDLERGALAAKRPLVDAGLTAEAIVAVVFTVGAESLDLPTHSRKQLAERIIQEVRIIMYGAESLAQKRMNTPNPTEGKP
jgi:TetR/AcrR family transcriptional regulator, fatty acid biosynthesis regulator